MGAMDIVVCQSEDHSDALLPDGSVLSRVHHPSRCAHRNCVIHNPTEHHMRDWPINVRSVGGVVLFERICEHACGHPDPDQREFWVEINAQHLGTHGCCGCCLGP